MQAKELIRKKRDGGELTPAELKFLLHGYLDGEIADYQMAAWLMAVFFQGLGSGELSEWTRLMWQSGRTLPRSGREDFWVDKHSTGGVGDKTSLILVPLVASVCRRLYGEGAVKLPMVSGRGLGHTGGTLDKLESVPGFSPHISIEQATDLLESRGFIMMGQTEDMAPADRLLYALRDVTGTVESLPLIVSSIMSKKLSENLDGIVFDVKCGRGAFMKTEESARALAEKLIEVAEAHDVKAVAVITDMNEPLGLKVGNHLEVEECADFLDGHTREPGLLEVVRCLASWMVWLGGRGRISIEDATSEIEKELATPRPLELFREMFEAQGGRWSSFERNRSRLEEERPVLVWKAEASGWIHRIEAEAIGLLVNELGGGRRAKEDKVDPLVGVRFRRKVGDYVYAGDTLCEVIHGPEHDTAKIQEALAAAVTVSEESLRRKAWVMDVCHGES